jgi:hypothetical protein
VVTAVSMDDLRCGHPRYLLWTLLGRMPPIVLIIEARKEVADALESAIALANVTPVVVPHVERLGDVPYTPAAIVVRIAFESLSEPPHAAIARLGRERPPVVAIVREENELAEAQRLQCEVVLRAPEDIPRLCEAVMKVIRN